MQKVKLPREVAEALDQIKLNHKYPIRAVVEKFKDEKNVDYPALTDYFEQDRSRRIETIMQALVNGYEVEETPEEKVRRYYEDYAEKVGTGKTVVLNVLHLLEITIPGVNDHGNS